MSSERPIDSSTGAKTQPARNGRAWHHSIGGKLLIAFGLIAALTVGGSSPLPSAD